MEQRLSFTDRSSFRHWLLENHSQDESIWIEFYKDGTKGISYDDALEESLCFGWIDSLVKRIDERVYVQKFSKRRKNSKWSERNKGIVEELIQQGLMTEFGLEAIREAKENGQWDKKDNREDLADIEGFKKVIGWDPSLISLYDGLTKALKKQYAMYYFDAKQEETRKKRLEKIMDYMKSKKRIL